MRIQIGAWLVVITILAAAMASPAYADHCKGKHRDGPGCGGDAEPPAVPVVVIRDSFGEIVGRVIDFIDSSGNTASVLYQGDPLDSPFFEVYPYIVLTVETLGFEKREDLFFATLNCQDQAYGDIKLYFDTVNVVVSDDVVYGPLAWIPVDLSLQTIPTQIQSRLLSDGTCQNVALGTVPLMEVDSIELGLYPPFTMGD